MFKIHTRDGHEYAMKPMNCPHHIQIYASELRSYRELPIRYSETTAVYRDEQSGELSGLQRVLSITQDDAHVFCRTTQVEEEVLKIKTFLFHSKSLKEILQIKKASKKSFLEKTIIRKVLPPA